MATQASAITFLSIPGQGFESGIGFVQNYFGLPLALIIVCAVFLPMYRRLNVYTAYEFLGRRFDREDAPARRRALPAAARPRRRRHHLRARDHPLHGARLAARSRHRVHRAARDRLHRHRRQRGGQPDAEVADGGDLRRHGDGLGRAAGPAARRARVHRRRARGRRPGQAAGGGLLARSEPALHALDRPARRVVSLALVLRHRPVAGAALHRRRLAARGPPRPDVQRRC